MALHLPTWLGMCVFCGSRFLINKDVAVCRFHFKLNLVKRQKYGLILSPYNFVDSLGDEHVKYAIKIEETLYKKKPKRKKR